MDRTRYPRRFLNRLGDGCPAALNVLGPTAHIALPATAFLCSMKAPGSTILRAFDQATAWRDAGMRSSSVPA